MKTIRSLGVLLLAGAWLAGGMSGCSAKDVKNETLASANGEEIKVVELREFLGVRGGNATAGEVPDEQKKEALDRLIAGRLLSQEARSRGLDNTDEFRNIVKQNEQAVLITALFRKEVDAKITVSGDDVKAEAKKLMAGDNTLSAGNADVRARQALSEAKTRKVEEDLIAAAKKEFPPEIDRELLGRIGRGEKVGEDAVLGTAGGSPVTYGEVRSLLKNMSGGMHGGQDLSTNAVAIDRMLDREVTGRALAAFARKQGIEQSPWAKAVRQDMERSILIDLLAEKEVLRNAEVKDEEIRSAYEEHGEMFVREGRKVPFSEVKEQIRGFLQNEKRRKVLEAFIEELRSKARITVNEGLLPKV